MQQQRSYLTLWLNRSLLSVKSSVVGHSHSIRFRRRSSHEALLSIDDGQFEPGAAPVGSSQPWTKSKKLDGRQKLSHALKKGVQSSLAHIDSLCSTFGVSLERFPDDTGLGLDVIKAIAKSKEPERVRSDAIVKVLLGCLDSIHNDPQKASNFIKKAIEKLDRYGEFLCLERVTALVFADYQASVPTLLRRRLRALNGLRRHSESLAYLPALEQIGGTHDALVYDELLESALKLYKMNDVLAILKTKELRGMAPRPRTLVLLLQGYSELGGNSVLENWILDNAQSQSVLVLNTLINARIVRGDTQGALNVIFSVFSDTKFLKGYLDPDDMHPLASGTRVLEPSIVETILKIPMANGEFDKVIRLYRDSVDHGIFVHADTDRLDHVMFYVAKAVFQQGTEKDLLKRVSKAFDFIKKERKRFGIPLDRKYPDKLHLALFHAALLSGGLEGGSIYLTHAKKSLVLSQELVEMLVTYLVRHTKASPEFIANFVDRMFQRCDPETLSCSMPIVNDLLLKFVKSGRKLDVGESEFQESTLDLLKQLSPGLHKTQAIFDAMADEGFGGPNAEMVAHVMRLSGDNGKGSYRNLVDYMSSQMSSHSITPETQHVRQMVKALENENKFHTIEDSILDVLAELQVDKEELKLDDASLVSSVLVTKGRRRGSASNDDSESGLADALTYLKRILASDDYDISVLDPKMVAALSTVYALHKRPMQVELLLTQLASSAEKREARLLSETGLRGKDQSMESVQEDLPDEEHLNKTNTASVEEDEANSSLKTVDRTAPDAKPKSFTSRSLSKKVNTLLTTIYYQSLVRSRRLIEAQLMLEHELQKNSVIPTPSLMKSVVTSKRWINRKLKTTPDFDFLPQTFTRRSVSVASSLLWPDGYDYSQYVKMSSSISPHSHLRTANEDVLFRATLLESQQLVTKNLNNLKKLTQPLKESADLKWLKLIEERIV